jgi:pyruvate/2-oxoglutarate dehydrogenase complex dihydrolipoamide acyltransferase (E2) component
MVTTIKMPQLGESVTEGTIERWLVKEGDKVEQYDPLFEVVTDKVNAEVPAEVAGPSPRSSWRRQTVKVGTPWPRSRPMAPRPRPRLAAAAAVRGRPRATRARRPRLLPRLPSLTRLAATAGTRASRRPAGPCARAGYRGSRRASADTAPQRRREPSQATERRA